MKVLQYYSTTAGGDIAFSKELSRYMRKQFTISLSEAIRMDYSIEVRLEATIGHAR